MCEMEFVATTTVTCGLRKVLMHVITSPATFFTILQAGIMGMI
jgi:hypothetical protein